MTGKYGFFRGIMKHYKLAETVFGPKGYGQIPWNIMTYPCVFSYSAILGKDESKYCHHSKILGWAIPNGKCNPFFWIL